MSLLPLDKLPGPLPATTPGPDPVTTCSPSPSHSSHALRMLSLLPLLLVAVWAAFDWRTVSDGAIQLASADPWWLLSAFFFMCMGWVAAACVRQGAVPERLPPGLLLASQVAAGTANHVLPASIGAHAVTLRFLQRQGISLARGTASLALYALVKPLAKTAVLLVFLVAFPGVLGLAELVPDERTLHLIAAGAGLAVAVAALLLKFVHPLRRPILNFVRTALTDARILHTRPSRVLALWGGAAATPLLQASVIASVGFSLGLPLTWAQVTFALLVASTAAGAVPAPGGIGPIDAALIFTMVLFGAPMSLATATIIGYRVLTIWVPLLPGMLILSWLVQRKVL